MPSSDDEASQVSSRCSADGVPSSDDEANQVSSRCSADGVPSSDEARNPPSDVTHEVRGFRPQNSKYLEVLKLARSLARVS